MTEVSFRIVTVAIVLFATMSGCARKCYDNPCGCVPYGYGAPPPLAHTMYPECETPIGGPCNTWQIRSDTLVQE